MKLCAVLLILVVSTLNPSSVFGGEAKTRLLNRDTTVKTGSTIPIRYRNVTGLKPEFDLYDPSYLRRVGRRLLTEIGTTGLYEAHLFVDPSWGLGNFTIVVSESKEGALDSMVMTVLATDQEGGTEAEAVGDEEERGPVEIRAKFLTLDAHLTTTVPRVAYIQSVVDRATGRLMMAKATVDENLAGRATLTAQQITDSVVSGVVVVVGKPSDPPHAPTVFGAMAQLQQAVDDLPDEVTGAVGSAGKSLKEPSVEAAEASGGVRPLSTMAVVSARQAVVLLEQIGEELSTRGKTEMLFDMMQQLARSLEETARKLSAIPKALSFAPIEAAIRELGRLLKEVNGAQGMNLDMIYDSLGGAATDLAALNVKMERLRALVDLNREMTEKILEKLPPGQVVIKTWLEPGTETGSRGTVGR